MVYVIGKDLGQYIIERYAASVAKLIGILRGRLCSAAHC